MGQQIFNSSGTFVVPADVTEVTAIVYGAGGGGAGGGGGGTWDNTDGAGGGGAGGAVVAEGLITVLPLANLVVTVGTGGGGGAGGAKGDSTGEDGEAGSPGGTGGDSSFETLSSNGGFPGVVAGGSGQEATPGIGSAIGTGGLANSGAGGPAAGGGGGRGGDHNSSGDGDDGGVGGAGGAGRVTINWDTPLTGSSQLIMNGDDVPMDTGVVMLSDIAVNTVKIILLGQDEGVSPVWSNLPPRGITDLTATTDEVGQVTLTWTEQNFGVPTSYRLYQDAVEVETDINSPFAHIVAAGTYDFYIEAANPAGITPSNTVSGTAV